MNNPNKAQQMAAILDEPPGRITGAQRERLVQLAMLSQAELIDLVRSNDSVQSREAYFVLTCVHTRGLAARFLDIVLDQSVRQYTRQTCGNVVRGRITPAIRSKVIDLLERRDPNIDPFGKVLLLQILAANSNREAVKTILGILVDVTEDASVRVQAADSIADLFEDGLPAEIETLLIQQLTDPSVDFRCAICLTLRVSKNEKTIAALEPLTSDKSDVDRSVFQIMPSTVGRGAQLAIEQIKSKLKHRRIWKIG